MDAANLIELATLRARSRKAQGRLVSGNLRAPNKIKFGRNEFRNWTAADIERVQKHKDEHYRKGPRN